MHSSSISQVQYQEFPQFNVFHLWNAQSKLPQVDLVFLQREGKKRQYTKKDRLKKIHNNNNIIIIYSLFTKGDVINPMSYLTYGLRQPDGID